MDFFDSEENMDPTLPLNEASSLPPHQAPQDSQWNIYRSTAGSGSGTPIFEGNLVERKNVSRDYCVSCLTKLNLEIR